MRIKAMVAAVLIVSLTGWVIARATAQSQTPQAASFGDVLAELKLLRNAVEVGNKNQALVAAIGVRQSRVQPLSAELVSIHQDLDAAVDDIREVKESLSELDSPIAPRDATLRSTLNHLNSKLGALRARENDVIQRLRAEEAAAAKLMAQLEQSIGR
jgi:chromosome segregation ATPase